MSRLNDNAAFLRALDANADPESGALLKVYVAGTTTPVTTYTGPDFSFAAPWPRVADASGNWGDVYIPVGLYRVRVEDASGALIVDSDNVPVSWTQEDPITFAEFVSWAATASPTDGAVVSVAAGTVLVQYIADSTATVTGLPTGWLPVEPVMVQHFGAVGDGSTDDATAFQNGVTYCQNKTLNVPAATYIIGSEVVISARTQIIGGGEFSTVLKTAAGNTGFLITVDDCWGFTANPGSISEDEWDLDTLNPGVTIKSLTFMGNRSTDGAGSSGLRTKQRCDYLCLEDVSFLTFRGDGLVLGRDGDSGDNRGLIRESNFLRVSIRECGTTGSHYPLIITNGDTAGDGTNQIDFISCNFVQNYAHVRVKSNPTAPLMRRLNFTNLMLHGRGSNTPVADDLFLIEGQINDLKIVSGNINGSHDVSSVKYAAIRVKSDGTDTPRYIQINGDIRSCQGDGYVIEDALNIVITGTASGIDIAGDEVRFEADSVGEEGNIYYVQGAATGRSINIDSTVEDKVSAVAVKNPDMPPIQVVSGKLQFVNILDTRTPGVFVGTDTTPEGAVTADKGSLYIKTTGDSSGAMDAVYAKLSGTGNTGWAKMQVVAQATQSQLRDISNAVNTQDPRGGQMVWDSTNGKPVWKLLDSAGAVWRDATGATAHTPV